MKKDNLESFILEEAEAIKKRRADLTAAAQRQRLKSRSKNQRFFDWWENKLIPTFWVLVVVFALAAAFGQI